MDSPWFLFALREYFIAYYNDITVTQHIPLIQCMENNIIVGFKFFK